MPVVTLKDLKRRLASSRIGEDIEVEDGFSQNGLRVRKVQGREFHTGITFKLSRKGVDSTMVSAVVV